ncbi:MAG: FAD-dependent oxidoreductase [Bacteroidales bacterium]|nr:FAD-dependent oxidoreductase [Bacteroidales bacterium]
MKTYLEPQRELPVRAEVDILVVGGGPSGIMAARAAARKGHKVLLIESRGYLGGNLTLGLPILAYLDINGKQCIRGYAQDLIDRLAARGCAGPHVPCKNHMSLTIIDPEEVKTVALEMMEEAGVEVLMYVFCSDVIMDGNTVKGVIIESKAGREVIFAKTVIDCTGDGDVATRAGVEMHKGDENGGMQPPTLMYSVRKVDMARFRDALVNHRDVFDMDVMPPEQFAKRYFITVGLRNQINQANAAGLDIPVARTILITGLKDDQIWVNMSRVSGVDSTLPESYTFGEIEARRQMYRINEYLRKYVPGFENLEVEKVAPFLGIRESRVMVGKYVLTAEDILTSRRFEDVITVAGYPVDIHHSTGSDCTMLFAKDNHDIPYRCLVPEKVENLLVAGRCSSFTHEAMAGTRVMSTCMALGQAAGTAACIALADGVKPSEVNVKEVQTELLKEGAFLG